MRCVVLDTETTGLSVADGHRMIEIGCVELIDREFTRSTYQQYIRPERSIDAAAFAVHGISNDFLKDKPVFSEVADQFLAYIQDAILIIHNAPFDLAFLNHELARINKIEPFRVCQDSVVDTLEMARKCHPGQRNSLDALCKRYGIDRSQRHVHGALLDAYLLASVYLAMTGGQSSFFDGIEEQALFPLQTTVYPSTAIRPPLRVLYASPNELADHESYLRSLLSIGNCLWLSEE